MIDRYASAIQPITISVPQGSILGPLLYLIYLNDIRYANDNADLDLFADDSNAFVVSNNLNDVFELANRVCSQMSI